MAAVLACGGGAVLSHISAGELWGMLRGRRPAATAGVDADAHVTVPTGAGRRPRQGIVIHRSRTLSSVHVTRRLGIPVTTPSRTLQDLRRALPRRQYAAALREAEYLRLPIASELERDRTRSELELRFLALCRRHRVPKPVVNARVGSFVVDFLWPDQRLVIELDGYRTHGGRAAFEGDRARDAKLVALGLRVVRFTWRRLDDDPAGVATTLRGLLRK